MMTGKSLGLMTLALMLSACSAYPWFWLSASTVSENCGKHPTQALGAHLAPVADSNVAFVVTAAGSSQPILPSQPLCPGTQYTVRTTWTQNNRALLTTSAGAWDSPSQQPCQLSVYLSNSGTSFTQSMTLPCNTTAPSVMLMITHARPGQAFLQASVTYTTSIACAATACGFALASPPSPRPPNPTPPSPRPPILSPPFPSPSTPPPYPPIFNSTVINGTNITTNGTINGTRTRLRRRRVHRRVNLF